MKALKRITALTLALLTVAGSCLFEIKAEDYKKEYPELLITEIGVDQYGDAANTKNTNPKYKNEFADRDPFEFIEIVNNSDKEVNVFDYMLAYQGAKSTNAEYFEQSIQEYTPFYPGEDWTDGPFNSYETYWKRSEVKKPVNPEYEGGKVKAGEVFVAWIYNVDSHTLNATVDEFRTFWGIDPSVKVFILDGGDKINEMNFSLKNQTTGTYAILHSSERFPKRRSSDKTFVPESTNTHHNYQGKNYEQLDEVIGWAIVDYTSAPLNAVASQNEKTNFTVSYLPYTGNAKNENGFTSKTFISYKRSHLQCVTNYAEATVGKLNDEQKAILKNTSTSVVKATSEVPVEIKDEKGRPSLIITEISPDNYINIPQNINKEWTNENSDPFECIEVYNNSAGLINIYDYMIGYQGSGATNVSTYFERLVQEYTPIFPGADWADAPYTAYDSMWSNTNVKRPVNPAYEDGVLKAGEVAVIWAYSSDSHKIHATVEEFRSFWSIPSDVKVFIMDAYSSRDKNFNIKNSETGTYIILKPCDKYPARRGDDETFETEKGDRLPIYYDLHAGKSYETEPEIISWAVVCFNLYEPLYSFSNSNGKNSASNNYTLVYAPYNGGEVFGNGFLTVSYESQKRMHLQEANTKAHIGVLTDAQKAKIAKAAS